MKKTIFVMLISLVLNAYYLPKYESIKTNNESGIVYLKATEFNLNKNIYIQLNSHNSHVNKWIEYDFSDDEKFQEPTKKIEPASTWSSSTSVNDKVTSFTNKYYYEILKDVSKKYLFIKFSGYTKSMDDDYLEIENTRINWGKLWTILFILFFGLIFLIFFGCYLYHKCIKYKCRKIPNIPLSQDQSEYSNSNNKPDNKVTGNPDFNNYTNSNSNNEYNTPQQQNIYYEPAPTAIDNNYNYYSERNINQN